MRPNRYIRIRPAFIAAIAIAFAGCKGGDGPQVPTTLQASVGASISGTVAQPVSTAPTVTLVDQKGRGINNVLVTWTVTYGGGKVGNETSRTNTSGIATSGGWTLGNGSGTQTLQATASGLAPTIFTAIAAPGSVAGLLKVAGDNQVGTVNTNVTTAPSVRAVDQFNNAVPGVAVTFAALNGGVITGGQKTTNAEGVASADSWKLGTVAGAQVARAQGVLQSQIIDFTVTAQGGAAVSLSALSSEAAGGATVVRMNEYASQTTCQQASVKLVDSYGNPANGGVVTFTPGPNSGSIGAATSLVGSSGIASEVAWTLGTAAEQTLVATSASMPGKSITFVATVAPAQTGYSLCARFIGEGGTASQRASINRAVARWRRVITGHVDTDRLVASRQELDTYCHDKISPIDETVRDLLIYVYITDIDGPGNILGQASPCYIYSASKLSLMGFFELDQADVTALENAETLDNVVLHEMGHIIGIGSLWNTSRALLVGRGSADPYFSGISARDQFQSIGGGLYAGNSVPVENSGGPGTRDSHWRRTIFRNELMQGYASAGAMPMSKTTVGSLADLGYQVSLPDADNFSLFASLVSGASPQGIPFGNDIADVRIVSVDRSGRREIVRERINPFKSPRSK